MLLQDLKLDYPTDNRTIAQPFGANFNSEYTSAGLKGHPAIDFGAPWGSPIYSASRGLGRVYKNFNKDNPDLMRYRAPCELIDLDDCSIEITYGHCEDIICLIGSVVQRQFIATTGNTGDVFQGQHEVTEAEKLAGSHAGAHLHFQLRKCRRVTQSEHDDVFLQDASGSLYMHEGYYYVYKNDGYNGCIDPAPYLDNYDQNVSIMKQEIPLLQKVITLLKQLLSLKRNT